MNNPKNPYVTPYQFKLDENVEKPKFETNRGLTFFDNLVIELAGKLLPTARDWSQENARFVVEHAENLTKFRIEALKRLEEVVDSQSNWVAVLNKVMTLDFVKDLAEKIDKAGCYYYIVTLRECKERDIVDVFSNVQSEEQVNKIQKALDQQLESLTKDLDKKKNKK